MNDGLNIIVFIALWIVISRFLLPKLGVPT